MKTLIKSIISVACILMLAATVFASEHNIFVDGSYNPGNDSDMDRLIDSRLADASSQIGRINPAAGRQTVDTKQALLNAIRNIECKCGDEINLYFMGHGGNERFVFSKQRGRERVITADELRDALEEAAKECCCKINVVIFACHSGSFIEPLMEGEHVRSVYASCLDDQLSYTNAFYDDNRRFQDGGDWMDGFNKDLEAVRRGTSTRDAIAEANKSAKEKMPIDFWEKQTPDAWVKDTLPVLAHVESRVKTSRGRKYVDVIFYEPEHLRGKKKRIYFGDNDFPDKLKACKWIQGTANFIGIDDPIEFTDDVAIGDKPRETILGHVTKRWKNAVEVHTLRPHWAFCDKKKIRPTDGNGIARNVQPCKWIEQEVMIHDPYKVDSTDSDIILASPTFKIQFHVEGVNPRTGLITGRVLSPRWLTYKKIIIDPRERPGLRNLKRCTNIWVDMTIPPEGDPTGTNLRQVHQDDIRTWTEDVAVNPIEVPQYFPMSKVIIPEIISTNTGERDANYTIEVTISEYTSPILDVQEAADIIDGYNNIPGAVKGEEAAVSPSEDKDAVYIDRVEVNDLEQAQSIESSFKPFHGTPGKIYRMCAAIISDNDEVEGNNVACVLFHIPEKKPVVLPETLVFTPRGTGRTTGHIITLTVTNNGDEAVSETIGYFIIPSTGKYQGYIIADTYLVSVAPGETINIPMEGYCIKVNLPPVGDGVPTLPFDQWITPDDVGPLISPDSPPSPESGFIPVDITVYDEIVPVYPGTDIPFPYKIDLDKHIESAAPIIYYVTEVGEDVVAESIGTGSFGPSISNNPAKLSEDMNQQEIWLTTGTLDADTTDRYDLEDLEEKIIDQIEETVGRDYETFDSTTKQAVDVVILDIYDGLSLVGEKAKVFKINTDKKKKDTGYNFRRPEKGITGSLVMNSEALDRGYTILKVMKGLLSEHLQCSLHSSTQILNKPNSNKSINPYEAQ